MMRSVLNGRARVATRRHAPSAKTSWSMISVAAAVLAFFIYAAFRTVLGDEIFWPSSLSVGVLSFSVALTTTIPSTYLRWILYFWAAWFIMGAISYYPSVYYGISWAKKENVSIEPYATIYATYHLATTIGASFFGNLITGREPRPLAVVCKISPATTIIVGLFPIFYILSMVAYVGNPPIISGSDFYSDLYSTNFGPLYGFAIILATASIMVFSIIQNERSSLKKSLFILYLFFCFFACVADGKRVNMMIAIAGIMYIYLPRMTIYARLLSLSTAGGIFLTFSGLVTLIRVGFRSGEQNSLLVKILTTGEEFRDAAYLVGRTTRDAVAAYGYDWFGSTFASLVNGIILSMFGVDKVEYVSLDSARTFQRILNENFGIRLGLTAELWFAYGWFGLVIMFLSGGVLIFACRKAWNETDLLRKSLWLTLIGNWTLAMQSQSTSLFGIVPTLLYVLAFIFLLDRMIGHTGLRTTPGLRRNRRMLPKDTNVIPQTPNHQPLEIDASRSGRKQ